MQRTVLITGVSGFVGFHLANRCLKEGMLVKGIDCRTNNLSSMLEASSAFSFKTASVDKKEELDSAFTEPANVIYHLAGQPAVWFANSHPREDFFTNIVGTINILEKIREYEKGKIVFLSTGEVYKNSSSLDEASPTQPDNFYGLSKLTAENYIRLYSSLFRFSYTILRFSLIYGPYFRRNVIYDIIKGFVENEQVTLYTSLESKYDFIYIDDAIDALMIAGAPAWNGETINISSGTGISVKEMLATVATLLHQRQYKPEIKEANLVAKVFSSDKAARMGWQPGCSFAQGVKKTLAWWQAEGQDGD
jgi:UDP-glucose 4-epimerase